MPTLNRPLATPILGQNPITVQMLGICSALAVTTTLVTSLTMSAALTAVLVASNVLISLIRKHIPPVIRLIVQITIIASLVIVADQLLAAYAFATSQRLSIFVGLIVTNCLVLGRAEGFAIHHPVWPSALDGLGNGLGYSLVLIIIGTCRELLGSGELLGLPVFKSVADGGWFQPSALMLKAPSAFFLLGLLIWLVRSVRPEQCEPPDFSMSRTEQGERQ